MGLYLQRYYLQHLLGAGWVHDQGSIFLRCCSRQVDVCTLAPAWCQELIETAAALSD
jgi:hypothetical protein